MTTASTRSRSIGACVNLLLPGGGLIVIGAVVTGLIVGVAFAACANFAIIAVLLFPDDFSGTTRMLAIGLAAGAYLGAQFRFAMVSRAQQREAAQRRRREQLHAAIAMLDAGDGRGALEALRPLAHLADRDLVVAFRMAQALTLANDPIAPDAWRRLRTLDRHGVYRAQVREHLSGPPKADA